MPRTKEAACLLVRDGGEDDVTPPLTALPAQRQHHRELHGDHVLHVHRAAAPHDPVDQLPAKRIARPGVAVDRDHVEVREQDERRFCL